MPGVEITDASWRVRTARDITPVEDLYLSATLHADRIVADSEIAVAYDAPGEHAVIDATLLEQGTPEIKLGGSTPFLEQNQVKTVAVFRDVRNAYWIGPSSALSYCPRTARVVARNALALTLVPELGTAEGRAARLRALGARDSSSLVVIMDTSISAGSASSLVAGAALNTTDSTLTDMVIGLVVVRTAEGARLLTADTTRSADTLEYRVSRIAPHELALFAGGTLAMERITKRIAYRQSDVVERDIAGSEQMNRASNAAREGRARVARRAQCAAGTLTCAK